MSWKRSAVSIAVLAVLGLGACGPVVQDRAESREAAAEAAYPPEGRLIEVAGRTVHAVVEGHGPDLVLIHGASGNTRDFTFSFVDQVKHRYRVIVFDRPGLGWTDGASVGEGGAHRGPAESPAEQARLLQAAAAKLGARRPIVLGQSYGGAVALAWALERPENISALVVVSGASNPWPGQLAPLYPFVASNFGGATVVPLMSAYLTRRHARRAMSVIFAPQAPPSGYAENIGVGLSLRRDSLRTNARQINGLRPHLVDMSRRYAKIDVPTEIIHGTRDRIVPFEVHSEPLAEQIPEANLVTLDGIGHMPHHAAPGAVIAAIDRAALRAGLR